VGPTKIGNVHHDALDFKRREIAVECTERCEVGDVSPGAASHEEALGEVNVVAEPWMGLIRVTGLGLGPEEGVEGIVVGGREAVFGAEAVVHGGDDGWKGGGEGSAGAVEDEGGGVVEDESAAVEVEEEGEFFGGGRVREKEAEGGVGGGVEGDVDGKRGFGNGGCRGRRNHRKDVGSGEGTAWVEFDFEELERIHGG